ncbi:MAG: hypothetical protein EBU96_11365, partial [Actinobacteria bacterium]|nr:hypothetical protein [Actinomycetota bacterium]
MATREESILASLAALYDAADDDSATGGPDLTRKSLMAAIDAKGASFASAALLPLNYSKTSHVG